MAFQMLIRIKIRNTFTVLSHTSGTARIEASVPKCHCSGVADLPKSMLNSAVSNKPTCLQFSSLLNLQSTKHLKTVNWKMTAEFSTSSAALKSSHPLWGTWGAYLRNSRSRSFRVGFCALLGALGWSATIAAFHLCSLFAMASRSDAINLDSESITDWKEAKKFMLSATQEKREALYRTSNFLPLKKIPPWTPSGRPTDETHYQIVETLNSKISLLRGDITKLEVDAIVNAANKTLMGGGGVDGAIHHGAGPLLKKECATLGGCETGQAKITGAYGLPAKYVIHTVGPIVIGSVGDSEREALRNCYLNCLDVTVRNQLRTAAFPCISTGVYGYPPQQAADVALATVREYLEDHQGQLDRVIFCVFLKSDEDLYQEKLPVYFPQGPKMRSKL